MVHGSALKGGVIFYGSAITTVTIQACAGLIQITHEDLNEFMSAMHGMTWSKCPSRCCDHTHWRSHISPTRLLWPISGRSSQTLTGIAPTYDVLAGTDDQSYAANRIVIGLYRDQLARLIRSS